MAPSQEVLEAQLKRIRSIMELAFGLRWKTEMAKFLKELS